MSENSSDTPNQQRESAPRAVSSYAIPGDSGNLLNSGTPETNEVALDNPYSAELAAASADQAAMGSTSASLWSAISDGTSSFWNASWRNWALASIGVAVVTIIVSVLAHGGSQKSMDLPSSMTPTQAAQAQTMIQKQLAQADKALKTVGVSNGAIQLAHDQVALTEESQVALATPKNASDVPVMPKKVTVYGLTAPNQYSALTQFDIQGYTSTLSADPTLSDLTENTAVIHGFKSSEQ